MSAANHLTKQLRPLGIRKAVLEQGAEADEVNEHRLAVAAVAAVAGVLGHVGINNHAVSGRIAEALRLVRLPLAEGLPAARGARHVLVHRSVDFRHLGPATGADFGPRHPWARCALGQIRTTATGAMNRS